MFSQGSHYLTYGATDQQTMRDLAGSYSGLVVPGTVAAFQREGTGGFVLTLSATEASPPYVIDPRFPLFQTAITDPKASHEALAELLGQPEMVRSTDPLPTDFDPIDLGELCAKWIAFNVDYNTSQSGKFAKYAARLQEKVDPIAARGPEAILAPYFVANGKNDDWWELSRRLFDETSGQLNSGMPSALRVIAAAGPECLDSLLRDVEEQHVVVWVSGLEELNLEAVDLATYGRALAAASERDQECFALYGGFFSVLLGAAGLRGACHGVGYGEHRNWPELTKSGPPPARYYVPRLHRYVGQDLALELWLREPQLISCSCPVCEGGPPILSYHELMKHSVYVRQAEIDAWGGLTLIEMATRLDEEHKVFESQLSAIDLPKPLRRPVRRIRRHLPRWSEALRMTASPALS